MLGKAYKVIVLALILFFNSNAFAESNELLNAVEHGNLNHVKQLLKTSFSVNSKGFLGATPLMKASFKGNEEMVKLLLDFGADLYAKDDGGATALHYAVRAGNVKIVELLVKAGADINVKDKLGFSPLHRASYGKNQQILDLLSESKYQISEEKFEGNIEKIEDPVLQSLASDKKLHKKLKKQAKSQKKNLEFKNTLLTEADFQYSDNIKKATVKVERSSVPPMGEEKIELSELSQLDSSNKDQEINLSEEVSKSQEKTGVLSQNNNFSDEDKSETPDLAENETDGIYVAEAKIVEDENDIFIPEQVQNSNENNSKKQKDTKNSSVAQVDEKPYVKPYVVQDLAEKVRAMKEGGQEKSAIPEGELENTNYKKFNVSSKARSDSNFKFSIVMDGFKNLDLAFNFWDRISNQKEFSSARISLSFSEHNGKEELAIIASYFPSNADAFSGCLRALKLTSGFACRVSQDY